MTSAPVTEAAPFSLRSLALQPEPIMWRLGLAMLLSLCLTVPALLLDTRSFQGAPIWLKPIKFQLALAAYFLTLAFFASGLSRPFSDSARMRRFLSAVVLATLAEMLWIGGAAMFGTASHYNTNIAMSAIYMLMGLAAILLTTVSLVMGVAFWRDRASPLPEPLRLSLSLGLILTFVLTLPTAGTLSSMPGHHIGTPVTGAEVPLLGWSREVGDLRAAHFLGTHALHFVPLFGLAGLLVRNARAASVLVACGALTYGVLTLGVFALSLAGKPII